MFRTAIISGALIGFTSVGGIAISAVHGATFEAEIAPTQVIVSQAQKAPAHPEQSDVVTLVAEVSEPRVESTVTFETTARPDIATATLRPRARPMGLSSGLEEIQIADNSQSRATYVPISKPDPKPTFLLGVYR
ncbi:MAG: hypothetical protein RID11_09915 [Roseovarius sp.]|jgi:hypothetical protein|uniref:hypothetical protein n=1 Tax=Roseovarius sp. TaxID=1486281 RepID=UPI0032EEAFF4